jgi:hypothetical protein
MDLLDITWKTVRALIKNTISMSNKTLINSHSFLKQKNHKKWKK